MVTFMRQQIAGRYPLSQGEITRMREIPHGAIAKAMKNPLLERIDERLKVLDTNDEAASKKSGLHKDTIRDLRRGKRQGLNAGNLAKLAHALETTSDWLLYRTDDETRSFAGNSVFIVSTNADFTQLSLSDMGASLLGSVPMLLFCQDAGIEFSDEIKLPIAKAMVGGD